MGLYERLTGEQEPHIPAHAFYALVAEVLRGKITAVQAKNALGLNAAEAIEVQTLVSTVQTAGMKSDEIDQILLLADARLIYTTAAALKTRFGVVG